MPSLRSVRPFDIAEQFTESAWGNRYFYWRGSLWVWSNGVWECRSREGLRGEVAKWLSTATRDVPDADGGGLREVPFNFSARLRDDVCSFVMTHEIVEGDPQPPFNAETKKREPGMDRLIFFRDKVVDVKTGEVRDRVWSDFHTVVLPFDWDEGAECPEWDKSVETWFRGDKNATELLHRRIGYLLMGFRGFDRIFLDGGVPRSGKGCVDRIESQLIGPENRMSLNLADMGDTFATQGLERVRELVLHEYDEGGGSRAESTRMRQLLKQIVGRDQVRVRGMYQGPRSLTVGAVPKIVGNAIPEIPDQAGGLWGKVSVLWYGVSHTGREDLGLEERLSKELPGIARRAVEAAGRLWNAKAGERWPIQEGARHAMEEAVRMSNPIEHWVQQRCERSEGSFVSKEILFEDYVRFCGVHGVTAMPRRMWTVAVRGSSMGPHEGVRRVETEEGTKSVRVFFGISLKSGGTGDGD